MITPSDLRKNAAAKLEDARVLLSQARYDGCAYISGYAIELALKARICDTLKWKDFPETDAEFKGLASFKIHGLEMLLRLSGVGDVVSSQYLSEWSLIKGWKPELRYKETGTTSEQDARKFFAAVETLIQQL